MTAAGKAIVVAGRKAVLDLVGQLWPEELVSPSSICDVGRYLALHMSSFLGKARMAIGIVF